MQKTIKTQKVIIVLAFITVMIATLCNYKQELEIKDLKDLVTMQQSVIADLEEDLRMKEEIWKITK